MLGEVTNQYAGILPDDPRMEPYWALAEELDLPVGIHIGTGPPGAIYLGAAGYRARMHSALTIEEVLVKHPKLRVYVMHAGYPMIDDLLAVLYAHPQVYVDVGIIVYDQPRAGVLSLSAGDRRRRLQQARDVRLGSDGVAGGDRARDRRDRRGAVPDDGAEARHLLQQRRAVPAVADAPAVTRAIRPSVTGGGFQMNRGLVFYESWQLAAHTNWRTGLRHIIPGTSAATTAPTFCSMTPPREPASSMRPTTVASSGFTATPTGSSWNAILPGDFAANGRTSLLFYDAAAGVGEFYATEQSGIRLIGQAAGWRTTWSIVAPFDSELRAGGEL